MDLEIRPTMDLEIRPTMGLEIRPILKQIVLAVHGCHQQHDQLPSPVTVTTEGIATSWRIVLGPYVEFANLTN